LFFNQPELSIVIATLNRADLLQECVQALLPQEDHFLRLCIIDNGNQGVERQYKHHKVHVYTPGRNLGCAASWNYGLRHGFLEDPPATHVLQLNDDIVLGPNQLECIREHCLKYPEMWFAIGKFYWAVWLMNQDGFNALQYRFGKVWDECFWPAYREDNDLHRRINLIDSSRYIAQIEELTPVIMRNSMTHEKEPVINSARSERYYIKKWGGDLGEETFKTPFNK